MEDASYGLHGKSVHGQMTMVVINKPSRMTRTGTSLCPGNTHGRKFIRDFEILLAIKTHLQTSILKVSLYSSASEVSLHNKTGYCSMASRKSLGNENGVMQI